ATSASTLQTNNIYILDIQNYTWVTTFDISTTTNSTKPTQSNEEFIETPGTFRNDHIHETHMTTVYTPGPPSEIYARTPIHGVPVTGYDYHSS
ncbi:7847_t:CDS:2, partial [Dentiscutata heterogama]